MFDSVLKVYILRFFGASKSLKVAKVVNFGAVRTQGLDGNIQTTGACAIR